ncbi:hypothetical protein GGR88_001470 [Sphingomonas jejuensis]|uniref:Uncharacterized protein n=1 Tax=Sphingomonas jejuensis TaxID=904715 RepID=A0ABX0XMT0_9SPHN|nr:SAM-dependent methyltransferase [Sphingomonas jejuensis]NJC33996.1 hypothetical protein [Sphingomonas jejuensis]
MSSQIKVAVEVPDGPFATKGAEVVVRICRSAQLDPRWAAVERALVSLRRQGRHAVRIVDADCSCGTMLIEVARLARALGFTAVEGRGIGTSPAMIGRARVAAMRHRDPAIGLSFEGGEIAAALAEEAAFPADILLWHGGGGGPLQSAIAAAARQVIGDTPFGHVARRAA